MSTVALIPARYGSTRFPGKPLADVAGKPLIQYSLENARDAVPTKAPQTIRPKTKVGRNDRNVIEAPQRAK